LNMNTAIIRGRLHDYIDQVDNEFLLTIYVLLRERVDPQANYDKATLDLLYKRLENDASGASASYSKEETLAYIRAHKPVTGAYMNQVH